jgi:polysaccharide pyruvyl transferase WcaK-like protein
MVVTGSYHGAVLALGQGIPAVCLHKTAYYWRKFAGLAELFGEGCALIDLTRPFDDKSFSRIVERLIQRADEMRPTLLDTTRSLVLASRQVHQRIPDLVRDHRQT